MNQQKNPNTAPDAASAARAADAPPQARVRFNPANVKSTYCNMCNATSTREEMVLNFGVNENWDRGAGDLEVNLEHRIILSPFAAKRLHDMLAKLLSEYEARYGELK